MSYCSKWGAAGRDGAGGSDAGRACAVVKLRESARTGHLNGLFDTDGLAVYDECLSPAGRDNSNG